MKNISNTIKFLSLFLSFTLFLNSTQAQTINRYGDKAHFENASFQEYQKAFTMLIKEGYKPVLTSSQLDYPARSSLVYTAHFIKDPQTHLWAAHHGLSAAQYQQVFNNWVKQGYMPTYINIAANERGVRIYCVIFEKIPNPPIWQARHELNEQDFQRTKAELTRQGYKQSFLTMCYIGNTDDGIYAVIWKK